jgi:phosphatidylinositol 4-phosphatase
MSADVGAHRFVLTMVLGFVAQQPGLQLPGGSALSLTLLARRAVARAGTRHWRRGIDAEGNVANFVETEQIMDVDEGKQVTSFVQVGRSWMWSRSPCS